MTTNLVPLIKKAKTGDEKAMLELYQAFNPLLLNRSYDPKRRINQDCYQELSLQFVKAVHAFDLEKYLKK